MRAQTKERVTLAPLQLWTAFVILLRARTEGGQDIGVVVWDGILSCEAGPTYKIMRLWQCICVQKFTNECLVLT